MKETERIAGAYKASTRDLVREDENGELVLITDEDGDFSDGAVTVRSILLPRSEDLTAPEVKSEWEGLLEAERQEGAIRLVK